VIRLWSLLFVLTVSLYGTTLTTHTLYEKPDRIDLMLTFDAPYHGKISRTQNKKEMILILENILFPEKKYTKTFHSDILKTMTIASVDHKILIKLETPHKINVNASKTIDNSGLRIRIQKATPAESTQIQSPKPIPSPVETKTDEYSFSFAFLKIMLVLGGLIALLWFLKKWLEKKSGGSWLFGENEQNNQIKVILQKPLDMKNRVVLLSYGKKEYLVLLGENNLLLDRFEDDEAAFDTLLQKSGKTLGEYLEK
jgi:flagellar biogenesis protein FliO